MCLVYYGPNRIAVVIIFIDGRLHRALCYSPKGGIVSDVSVGTGIISRYHANGELWEKRFYNRGVYVKREEFRYGKLWKTTEDMAIGNRIANDGLEAFMLRCEKAKKAVFNTKNGKVLAGIILSVVVGLAVSKLIQKLDSGDKSAPQGNNQTGGGTTGGGTNTSVSPPGGYYRNSLGQIEPINPNFAGYYRSSTGNVVPIRKSGTAILPTSDPIALGNLYLNPDTGLMTPITIVWPIQ